MKPPSFVAALLWWMLLLVVGLSFGFLIRAAWSQSVLEAPLSIQPKAGDSPTMQFDFTPGLDCKSLASKPAETLGMYRLCAQNKVVWVDFGAGYVKAFPALPMSKVVLQCSAATLNRKGLLASSCSLIQQ